VALVGDADVDGAVQRDAVPGQAQVVGGQRAAGKAGQRDAGEDGRGEQRLARRENLQRMHADMVVHDFPSGRMESRIWTRPPPDGCT
jgi:hypothetical protein